MIQTMQNTSIRHSKQNMSGQLQWQRTLLLIIIGYEAAGCLLGGSLLVSEPDGSLMKMPVSIMHGAFSNFMIPGVILFGLGILNTFAFIFVLRRHTLDWLLSGLALGGLAIWFWIEIAILQELHWLHAMWGLPVLIGALVAIPLFPSRIIRQGLLVCGILASLLYIAINIIVAMQWKAYDVATQTVSELSAIGAPTRTLWIVLSAPYTLLIIAFGWGVWKSAEGNKPLRIAGWLLLAYAILGILWPFAPMHLRQTLAAGGSTFSDTVHLSLGMVTEIIYLLALGFAAVAFGKYFRIYSILTFLLLLVFGVLTFLEAPNVALNQPTPYIGVWERINIGIFLVWTIVLSVILLRQPFRDFALV